MCLLSLYRVTPTGQIEFEKQRTFTYAGFYQCTKNTNMRLKLSQNGKIVSLTLQEKNERRIKDTVNMPELAGGYGSEES